MRDIEVIKAEIDKAKQDLFYEQMADFMNWSAYNAIKKRIARLEAELIEAESQEVI